jgi:exodeoxyribonuclease VII large subunit
VRAPTPTGAAEMAVPVKAELEATLASLSARLSGAVSRAFERKRQAVLASARALPSPDMLLALPRRRFDEAVSRLERGLSSSVDVKRTRFINGASMRLHGDLLTRLIERKSVRMNEAHTRKFAALQSIVTRSSVRFNRNAPRISPQALLQRISSERQALSRLMPRADRALSERLSRASERLGSVWRLAEGLSHRRILERGFALVRDGDGHMVRSRSAVSSGAHLTVSFADGSVGVIAEGDAASRPVRPKRSSSAPQDDLFGSGEA